MNTTKFLKQWRFTLILIATMINSSGDTIAAMIVSRLLGKNKDINAIKTTRQSRPVMLFNIVA